MNKRIEFGGHNVSIVLSSHARFNRDFMSYDSSIYFLVHIANCTVIDLKAMRSWKSHTDRVCASSELYQKELKK
jgi:hypothetical protein